MAVYKTHSSLENKITDSKNGYTILELDPTLSFTVISQIIDITLSIQFLGA